LLATLPGAHQAPGNNRRGSSRRFFFADFSEFWFVRIETVSDAPPLRFASYWKSWRD